MWSKLARNLPKFTKLRKSTPDWSKVPPGSGQNRRQIQKSTEDRSKRGQKSTLERAKTRLYDSRRQVQKSAKLKTRETSNPKPRKGGVSCGTFKCTYIVKRILSCLYIGVSGGHQRPVAGTLTRLTKHLKPNFIKPAWEKQQTHY